MQIIRQDECNTPDGVQKLLQKLSNRIDALETRNTDTDVYNASVDEHNKDLLKGDEDA